MKARFGRLLCGLLGSGLMAAALHPPQAVALTEDELLERFSEVPVFVVADANGGYVAPVVDLPNDGIGNVALMRIFFTEDDARAFVEQIREQEPRFNQGGSVGVIDLATVHRIAQDESQDVPLKLIFIPQADELEAARALDSNFGAGSSTSLALVPLFAIQDAEGNYVSLSFGEETNESIFSMFFSKEDADSVLTALRASDPNLPDVSIGVVSLANFSNEILTRDDEAAQRVRFLPDSDVINHIQNLNLE